MEKQIPEVEFISAEEWKENFELLQRQIAEREVFASVWFPGVHVCSATSGLRAEDLAIYLEIPSANPRASLAGEILLLIENDRRHSYQLCKTGDGDIFLQWVQEPTTLVLSNSWKLLQVLETGDQPPLELAN